MNQSSLTHHEKWHIVQWLIYKIYGSACRVFYEEYNIFARESILHHNKSLGRIHPQ